MPDYHVKRCFIALPIDAVAIADFSDVMEGIEIEGLRPTRPENLHATLKFLGDVDDPDLPGIIDALAGIAAQQRPFELTVSGITYLPNPRRPRVLAATMDRPPPLSLLFGGVEQAVFDLGFPREGRAYHPHITLGRFKKPPRSLPPPDAFPLQPMTLPIDRFVLMQSTLRANAPEYTPLAEFLLGG